MCCSTGVIELYEVIEMSLLSGIKFLQGFSPRGYLELSILLSSL